MRLKTWPCTHMCGVCVCLCMSPYQIQWVSKPAACLCGSPHYLAVGALQTLNSEGKNTYNFTVGKVPVRHPALILCDYYCVCMYVCVHACTSTCMFATATNKRSLMWWHIKEFSHRNQESLNVASKNLLSGCFEDFFFFFCDIIQKVLNNHQTAA